MRRGFWRKVRRVAARLPFAEDLLAAYYCAFDRDTPMQVKAALIGALAYFVLPFDAMPDMMPMLGFADDAAMLATALRLVASHLRAGASRGGERALERLDMIPKADRSSEMISSTNYGCRITFPITLRSAIALSAAAVSSSG